jgi:hypothetical protein
MPRRRSTAADLARSSHVLNHAGTERRVSRIILSKVRAETSSCQISALGN